MKHPYIPYGHQSIDEEDICSVVEVLKSDFLTTGPKIQEFEQKVAEYVGCKYAVAVSSGTAALHAACFAADINTGDEIITTPMTFAASANCVLYVGGIPVFADINPETYNIDPLEIEKKITEKTKAIIAVDFTGQPADLFKIKDLAEKHNIVFIEDGSHSLGAEIKDGNDNWKKIGGIAHMTTFSFHPVKHITTGEGGMICTNDLSLYKKLILFRTHGITREKELMKDKQKGRWYYEQLYLGYNYRMSDLQAALGVSQLKKLDNFISRRREIATKYDKVFGESKLKNKITIPFQAQYIKSAYHIYVLRFNLSVIGKSRDEIFNKLSELNIGVNVHYIPVYYHPYYEALGCKRGLCPRAEKIYEDIITLPIYPGMSDEDVAYVIESVVSII